MLISIPFASREELNAEHTLNYFSTSMMNIGATDSQLATGLALLSDRPVD